MKATVAWHGVSLLLTVLVLALAACTNQEKIAGADLTCADCHNDTTSIFAKRVQWEQSVHATGGAYVRATSASCAGCHSSEGFTARVAAGISPDKVTAGQTNPTPPNCRTCHKIHTTYTGDDLALKATGEFTLYVSGQTFNFGKGNLCAQCHQPRMAGPTVGAADVKVDSNRWGPHHGPQSTSLIGVGGWNVRPTLSPHYLAVKEGCPVCHMTNATHDMTPDVAVCKTCHSTATSFDVDGVQTDVKAKLDQLSKALAAKGLLKDGLPVPGTYPNALAGALWNYLSVMEDRSSGVHNAQYLKALLQAGLDALK